jgi:hypothetical protein
MSAVARNRLAASCQRACSFPGKLQCATRPAIVTCRYFSDRSELDYVQKQYVIQRRGDPGYLSREYLLLPPNKTVEDSNSDESLKVAALLAHRNIVFGARSFHDYSLKDVCRPLLEIAVQDSGEKGEQPQAIASLVGLSDWVKTCLETNESDELAELKSNDLLAFEAVQAIATGIPREGHSVVGIGTYRDAEEGWKKVATEFIERELSEEANLYKQSGGRLVGIEHMADKSPEYLASAGGAMARLFFL